jgi:hypothetical protein
VTHGQSLKRAEKAQATRKGADLNVKRLQIHHVGDNNCFKNTSTSEAKKLLKLVASLDCQLCGSGVCVQAAHTNWGGGKGKSIKASDEYTAALCQSCHYDIDQGAKWSKAERQQAWSVAHYKTVQTLTDNGQWPVDIPVPELV